MLDRFTTANPGMGAASLWAGVRAPKAGPGAGAPGFVRSPGSGCSFWTVLGPGAGGPVSSGPRGPRPGPWGGGFRALPLARPRPARESPKEDVTGAFAADFGGGVGVFRRSDDFGQWVALEDVQVLRQAFEVVEAAGQVQGDELGHVLRVKREGECP